MSKFLFRPLLSTAGDALILGCSCGVWFSDLSG